MAFINGTDGNDTLMGTGDFDIINGKDGNDDLTLIGNIGGIINANEGDDTVKGSSGPDILNGDDGNDIVIGRGGDDTLRAGDGTDILTGARLSADQNGALFMAADETGIDLFQLSDGQDIVGIGGRSQDGTQNFIHYDEAGDTDYALVENFVLGEDKLFLGAGDYTVGAVPAGLPDAEAAVFVRGTELVAVIRLDDDVTGTFDLGNDAIIDV